MDGSQPSSSASNRGTRSKALVFAVLSLLLLGIIIGARYSMNRAGAPFAGLQRLAKTVSSPEAEPQAEADTDDMISQKVPKAGDSPQVLPDNQQKAATPPPAPQPEGRGVSISISLGSDGSGNLHFNFASEDMVSLHSDELKLSESQKVRVAAWSEWKAKAIEALTEAERNDPKKVKEIDDAYREGVTSELDQSQAAILQKAWSRPPIQWGSEPPQK